MAKNLFQQFINSWVRQMGRESAHTDYGTLTGRNQISEPNNKPTFKPFPDTSNYVKTLLAQIIPIIGPVLTFIFGCIRAFGNTMSIYEKGRESVYVLDRRYSDGRRYAGERSYKKKVDVFKKERSEEEVEKFNFHAYCYIIIAILGLMCQLFYFSHNAKRNKLEHEAYQAYSTSWHEVSMSDDFTNQTSTYQMLYATIDGEATSNVVLLYKENKYFLLLRYYATLETDYIHKKKELIKIAKLETNINGKIQTIDAIVQKGSSHKYLTPEQSVFDYRDELELPKDIFTQQGVIKFKLEDKIYQFTLN